MHKASPLAQPMLPQDIPDSLWQEIATNYFHHKGKVHLLVYNLFSTYPFLSKSFLQISLLSVPKATRTHQPVQTAQPPLHR